jgi:archaellum component FlaF (FlaF/FlaG flagellin family)
MPKVEEIKNDIIGKILSISNEDFLEALDKLIDSSNQVGQVNVTPEQRIYLEMSEEDILAGRIVSEQEMKEYDKKWQSGK